MSVEIHDNSKEVSAQVEEHARKVKNPDKYDTGWSEKDDRQKQGSTSQKFRHGGVEVTVNPNTVNLIQTNPKAKKGVVKYD